MTDLQCAIYTCTRTIRMMCFFLRLLFLCSFATNTFSFFFFLFTLSVQAAVYHLPCDESGFYEFTENILHWINGIKTACINSMPILFPNTRNLFSFLIMDDEEVEEKRQRESERTKNTSHECDRILTIFSFTKWNFSWNRETNVGWRLCVITESFHSLCRVHFEIILRLLCCNTIPVHIMLQNSPAFA